MAAEADAGFAVSFGRDIGPCVLVIDQCPEGIAIISLADQHHGFFRQGSEQVHCGVSIPGLARRQAEPDRQTPGAPATAWIPACAGTGRSASVRRRCNSMDPRLRGDRPWWSVRPGCGPYDAFDLFERIRHAGEPGLTSCQSSAHHRHKPL